MYVDFLIDSLKVTSPKGWDELKFITKRDETIRGLVFTVTSDLTFYKDAYARLREFFFTPNIQCGSIPVVIMYSSDQRSRKTPSVFVGSIYFNDIEWDIQNCTCKAKVTDNTFAAMIATNKKIKFNIGVSKTKNGLLPDYPATAFQLSVFDPVTGVYDPNTRFAYNVTDTIAYLVSCMTDNRVVGSFVEYVPLDTHYFCLMSGKSLRDSTVDQPPYISFEELYIDISKLFNLTFYIDGTTLNIYPEASLFTDFVSVSVLANNLTEEYDANKFPAKVQVGSNAKTQDADGGAYVYPDILLRNWKPEEYHVLIDCNVDNALDLTTKTLVMDTNVIDDVVRVSIADDQYDKESFIIEYEDAGGGAWQAKQYDVIDPIGGGIFSYNDFITNEAVIRRSLKKIPNKMALYLDDTDDLSDAHTTPPYLSPVLPFPTVYNQGQIICDIEDADAGANYDPVTGFYTVPRDGYYKMGFGFKISGITLVSNTSTTKWVWPIFRWQVRRYDTTGLILLDYRDELKSIIFNTLITPEPEYNGWLPVYAKAGDIIGLWLDVAPGGGPPGWFGFQFFFHPDIGSCDIERIRFGCIFESQGGGEFDENPIDECRFRNHEFDSVLGINDWLSIVNFAFYQIEYENKNNREIYKQWIETMEYSPSTGRAKFKTFGARHEIY